MDVRRPVVKVWVPRARPANTAGVGASADASCLIAVLLVGVGTWAYWAQQRPGGISGTIEGWVKDVRGDVAKVSSDPDLAKARRYFNGQYAATNSYPNLGENDLASVGIGVGVTVEWCSAQAVVIQGASGGGTASRLLLGGPRSR